MAKTIIQPIGPLYGEVVNGTVFGQPNGSVYVPPSNVVNFTSPGGYIKNTGGTLYRVRLTSSDGSANYSVVGTVAMQDMTSNVRYVLSTSASDDDIVAVQNLPAGVTAFNNVNLISTYELTPGNTYYYAVQIVNNGTVIASTEYYEVVAV